MTTLHITGSATGTVRDPTPSERLLQAEVARLRDALKDIASGAWNSTGMNRIAREALKRNVEAKAQTRQRLSP